MKIPLSKPDITVKEKKAVMTVLNSSTLSIGPKLIEFEKKFAKFVGAKYAIAVNSGTSGLHLCVRALNIKEGDEVITTPFSFIASTNCLLFEKAKPVFVDIREDTLNLDERMIEQKITAKTKAILVVHIFGFPCEMIKINQIAKKYGLAVIEDACEALGAYIDDRHVGTFGDCGVFAFYPNKQMTAGEGGMVVTNNSEIAEQIRSMRNQGRNEKNWLEFKQLGFNYRLSELNCSLGVAQLDRLPSMLVNRTKVASIYEKKLSGLRQILLPPMPKDNRISRSWFVYVIRLDDHLDSILREKIINYLKKRGIGCNIYFPTIHLIPFLKYLGYKKGDFPIAEWISERTIALPFFNRLKNTEINFIRQSLEEAIKKNE